MKKEYAITSALGAFVLPLVELLYGEGDAVITIMAALLFFIIMDWLSGIRAAKIDNTYGSRYGIDGIFRSFFILLLPSGAHLLDLIFKLPGVIFGALALGTLYHVLQSTIANAIRAGWSDWLPLPVINWMMKWVESELDKKVKRAASRKGVSE